MNTSEKKAIVVDHLDSTTIGLPRAQRCLIYRAFASVMSHEDLAAVLFSWADELEAADAKNELLRLEFKQNLTGEPETEEPHSNEDEGEQPEGPN
jgi:hypothetical protein